MTKVSIISFTKTESDNRVLRQIKSLAEVFDLTVYGFGVAPEGVENFVSFSEDVPGGDYRWFSKIVDGLLLMLRLHSLYFWRNPDVVCAASTKLRQDCDVYIANDFQTLPYVLRQSSPGAKVVLDAHEYAPDEIPPGKWYRPLIQRYLRTWLVGKHISKVDGMMTVSAGIANTYAERYFIPPPVVVTNATRFHDLQISEPQKGKIRLVHHGVATRARGLDLLIQLLERLDDRFELNLILRDGEKGYLEEIRRLAKNSPRVKDIHFYDSVTIEEIPLLLNQFDVGVYLLKPQTTNEALALPNKFFEFLQARLAFAIGPSREMASIVNQHGLGLVSHDFSVETLAKELASLTEERITKFKQNSSRAAATLCAENEMPAIRQLVSSQN